MIVACPCCKKLLTIDTAAGAIVVKKHRRTPKAKPKAPIVAQEPANGSTVESSPARA